MSVAEDDITNRIATPSNGISTPSNGIPETTDFEQTGRIATAFSAQAQAAADNGSAGQFMDEFAKKLLQHGGVPPDGGNPAHAKSIKRHNWLAIIMSLLLGPGGAIAVIYATSDRSKENSHKVDELRKLEPRVGKTEDDIQFIRVRVKEVGTAVELVKEDTGAMVIGIAELKNENLNRLKQELAEARREIRRRDRQD